MNKHQQFAETMRNIMRNSEESQRRQGQEEVERYMDEEWPSLRESLEDSYEDLFGWMEDED